MGVQSQYMKEGVLGFEDGGKFFTYRFVKSFSGERREETRFSFVSEGEGVREMLMTMKEISGKGKDFFRYAFFSDSRLVGRMRWVHLFWDLSGRRLEEGELDGMISRLLQEALAGMEAEQSLYSISLLQWEIDGKKEENIERVFEESVREIKVRIAVIFCTKEMKELLSHFPEVGCSTFFLPFSLSLRRGEQGVFFLGHRDLFFVEEGSGAERQIGNEVRGLQALRSELEEMLGVGAGEGKMIMALYESGGMSREVREKIEMLYKDEEEKLRALLFAFCKRKGVKEGILFAPYQDFSFSQGERGRKSGVAEVDLGKNKAFSFDAGLVSFDYKEGERVRPGFLLFLLHFGEVLFRGGDPRLISLLKRRMEWMGIL